MYFLSEHLRRLMVFHNLWHLNLFFEEWTILSKFLLLETRTTLRSDLWNTFKDFFSIVKLGKEFYCFICFFVFLVYCSLLCLARYVVHKKLFVMLILMLIFLFVFWPVQYKSGKFNKSMIIFQHIFIFVMSSRIW